MPLSVLGVCREPREHHPRIIITDKQAGVSKTKMNILAAHGLAYRPHIYGNCVHTQYAALAERHIKDRSYIGFDHQTFRQQIRKHKAYITNYIGKDMVPIPAKDIVAGYSGGKRAVYERALVNLRNGFDKKWAGVRMFVKPDKIPYGEILDKAPRAIQYRRPEFNLLLGQFLKPFEEKLYKLCRKGLRVFAKGRNLQQRAKDILEAYNRFDNCKVVELDHKKFDSCVLKEHLKTLHSIYLKAFNNCYWLKFLLGHQIYNKGRSSNLTYKVTGTRMSGDFDTGLGNSLLNFLVLCAALEAVDIQNFHIYIDGDDSLLFISAVDVSKLDSLNFNILGFETTMAVKDLVTAEFCKTKLIRCDPPVMVRDPIRIISHLQVCLKDYGPSTYPEIWQGKLICEYWANQGVPYLMKFFSSKLDKNIKYYIPTEEHRRWGMVRDHKIGKVTPQAYRDLEDAYGFGPIQAQLLFTPIASAYPESERISKHSKTQKKKRARYVWTPESIHRVRATFPTLDCSPSIRCGAGCRCRDFESGRECWELALPAAH